MKSTVRKNMLSVLPIETLEDYVVKLEEYDKINLAYKNIDSEIRKTALKKLQVDELLDYALSLEYNIQDRGYSFPSNDWIFNWTVGNDK